MQLKFKPFNSSHFAEYQKWFGDPGIKRYLGGIDEEWLAYIENEPNQREFAVCYDDKMIGEIGIVLPTEAEPYNVITNLAVNPAYQSQGIGKLILNQVLALRGTNLSEKWVAFIEPENGKACNLFTQSGWDRIEPEKADEEMICFLFGKGDLV